MEKAGKSMRIGENETSVQTIISTQTFKEFKKICIDEDKTIKEKTRELIEEYVAKNKK